MNRCAFPPLVASLLLLWTLTGCSTPGTRARQQPAAFHRLAPADRQLVLHGEVRHGLDKDAVSIAWGKPDEKTPGGKGHEQIETWIYERRLTLYAPFGSYDQFAPGPGLYDPGIPARVRAGYGFGGSGSDGFLFYHPRVQIVDDTVRRAEFVDGKLERFEVRHEGIPETPACAQTPCQPSTPACTAPGGKREQCCGGKQAAHRTARGMRGETNFAAGSSKARHAHPTRSFASKSPFHGRSRHLASALNSRPARAAPQSLL